MPSYQLFEIDENFKITNLQNEDVLNEIKANKDDPQTLKTFINSAKKSYRNLNFKPLKQDSAIQMVVEEYTQFQDKQTLWINREKMIIKQNTLLLIGKTDRKIERIIQIYLRDSANVRPVIFKDKYLWQIWKNLKSYAMNYSLDIKLHRLILKKTYINADKIKEMNIHANDVNELGLISDLLKQTEQVKTITVKIRGFYNLKKWITVRIDKNGSILIYGKHDLEEIIEFLKIIVQSL
jgi:hypothetical protein